MTLPYAILLPVLTVLASLSPVLTFARLWQIKEWRCDRLREHMRENGWWRQLFGWTRPMIVILYLALLCTVYFVLSLLGFGGQLLALGLETKLQWLEAVTLGVLTLFSVLQSVTGRQRTPVWTRKAIIITALSLGLLLITSLVGLAIESHVLPILPLLAPLFVGAAWMIFLPIDKMMKQRILKRAEALRVSHPNLRIIGITGSVGKTTVKEMLSHILKDTGALTTPERVNTEMGVAAWMTKILSSEPADSNRLLIIEMGAYRTGEIGLLCRITKPQYGIITYVGNQHLSLFGSRAAIIKGKGELFASLPKNGRAFGNSDNDAFDALKKKCVCPLTAVGTGQHADIVATDIEETPTGIQFRALDTSFRIPVAGTHNVTGALLAIAVAKEMGMKPQDIAPKLQSFKRMSRTFELKTVDDVTVLDDTYNSSPDSVRAAIEWARKQPHDKKILVLEGIIELGDAEARIHTELAALAAPVFTEAYAAHPRFLSYLKEGGFGDRAKMAEKSLQKAEKGSLVVLVGRLAPKVTVRFI